MKKFWLFIMIGQLISFGIVAIASNISVNTIDWPKWIVTLRNAWFFPFGQVLTIMYGPSSNDISMTGFYSTLLGYTVVAGVVIALVLRVLFSGLLAITRRIRFHPK